MQKLINFRDLGGIITETGKKVKKNKLFRSAALNEITEEDEKELVNKNLTQIIDFRTEEEIAKAPNKIIKDVNYLNLDILSGNLDKAVNMEELFKIITEEDAINFMKKVYVDFINTESAIKGYKSFLESCLLNEEGATLFHCAVGKDRTGFAAALILKVLGVSEEAILEDYMKTEEQRKEENEKILEEYRKKGLNEKNLQALFGVREEFLKGSFKAIKEQYKSFDAYLKENLQISDETINKLKEIYLED